MPYSPAACEIVTLRERLAARAPARQAAPNCDWAELAVARRPMPAAVLVPVVVRAAAPSILLTKRTDHLHHHPGQISFPGGRV